MKKNKERNMIKKYVADYRYDEGLRIRNDFICPTLCSGNDFHSPSVCVYVIEVIENEKNQSEEHDK